ncbi:flagellar export apparatus protein FliQ [Pseudorhodoferax aquiterrae]|uniref:Flagellar biosynthetic protein FliQ n=1 Tax=Pseudorhodoferax aquiterrae TaxID=747304 RepID=A0ABQ3G7E7_9BURK|nr:flagellar biosynthesis protein FliQ [Pseudorhodoferax aquiterrae]GHC93046.1 flagellar export apparatus protein FliQ [Pseudorhodoferax aquiterrae]
MSPQFVFTVGQDALVMMLMVAAPLLLIMLAVGFVVSVFQALTQINEPTLSFVPKLVAAVLVLALAGAWMLSTLVDYIRKILESIPSLVQ